MKNVEETIAFFQENNNLPIDIVNLEPNLLEEWIDAIPDEFTGVIAFIRSLLRREGL